MALRWLTTALDILLNAECQWCFTAPPWWGADARAALKDLVLDAGIDDVDVICQPTAVLTYFAGRQKSHPWHLGDTILCYHTETAVTV